MTKPAQVYINVSGGVAESTVMRGKIETVQIDWDDLNDASDISELEEARDTILSLSDTIHPTYRAQLLADIAELIENYIADEAEDRLREEEHRQKKIAEARETLRAAGELPPS